MSRKAKIIFYSILLILFAGLGIGSGNFIATLQDLPRIEQLKDYQPSLITKVYSDDGEVIAEFFRERREIVDLPEVPLSFRQAFIALEDQKFYQHHGIDIKRIFKAAWVDLTTWSRSQGASTITQQLARTLFLTLRKTLSRKIKEIILAIQIEKKYSKDEILRMYFNQMYFGQGIYGVGEAASFYFGKKISELNLAESALLAGIPNNPSRYSPLNNLPNALKRKNFALQRMREVGFISKEEEDRTKEFPIKIVSSSKDKKSGNVYYAPYFAEWVRQKIAQKYGYEMLWRGGLKVYTTLNLKMQQAAEEALIPYLKEKDFQGALLAMDPHTGFVRAMVGGRDFNESEFNRTTQAYRQTGSAFKVFTYTAAIDSRKFTPVSSFFDAPIAFKRTRGIRKSGEIKEEEEFWSPQNYEKHYWGKVFLWQMLIHSINVASVKLLEEVGIGKVANYAKKMGIDSPLNYDLTLTLGSSSVTLLEMVRGYATIANYGIKMKPIFIQKVKDSKGNILEENFPSGETVISSRTSFVMIDLLKKVIDYGTGRRIRWLGFDRPCAGKTGTVGWPGEKDTDKTMDAWFIGFTPDLVAGVWIGRDDGSPLGEKLTGSVAAIPVWTKFMKKSLKDKPVKDFPSPPEVVFKRIDLKTGSLAAPESKETLWFAFLKGTSPQNYSKK
ncbi:PBP1A family penicillin-binding protein [Patescibacteria group bacterium]|nr:PBP1A family penicillin-binding protein [Patescibacteria group bacterium]